MNKIIEFIIGHIKITFFICAAVLSFAVYAQTLKYDFVYLDDDVLIIDKIQILSDYKTIPSYFYKSVFAFGGDKYFRPGLIASFAADAILGGLNSASYHHTDILLHILGVFLIFVFLINLGFDKKICFAFCSLFAVCPAFVQAVAWLPGRNDVLLAVFVMPALIFLMNYLKTNKKIYLFLHTLMFLAALFVKETAVVLTAIIPFMIFLFNRENFKISEIKKIFFLLALALVVYFSFRYAALHNSRGSVPILGSLKYLLHSLPCVFQYCDYLINPSRLSVVPSHIDIDFFSFISAFIIFGVPFISSFAYKRGGKTVVAFGFIWFVLFLFPTLILPSNNYFSHRLYLPAVGVIIMWTECLPFILKDIKPFFKKLLLFIFIVILFLFALASFFQTKKFQNREIFWFHALNDAPSSAFVVSSVGMYYYDNKIYGEAEKYFLKAVSLSPSDYRSYNNLGNICMFKGDVETAVKYFEQSLNINPNNDTALYNLSQLYYILGNVDEAYTLAKKAIELEPQDAGYREHYDKVEKNVKNSRQGF
ncbi:MAG: tetratricopeptide repeat protein [Endomicrobium sp.]|nr:tetratricopeptide repeat protein [Endomicrobium sp.]